jgi:ribonuclease HI
MYLGSKSLGPLCMVSGREVVAIENGISTLSWCGQPFKHVTDYSDSTAAIARVHHNMRGPGQSWAVKLIRRVKVLYKQRKRISISSIKSHNDTARHDHYDAIAGSSAEDIYHSTSSSHQVWLLGWTRKFQSTTQQ